MSMTKNSSSGGNIIVCLLARFFGLGMQCVPPFLSLSLSLSLFLSLSLSPSLGSASTTLRPLLLRRQVNERVRAGWLHVIRVLQLLPSGGLPACRITSRAVDVPTKANMAISMVLFPRTKATCTCNRGSFGDLKGRRTDGQF